MAYAAYTNLDHSHTGNIHIVGLNDDDYVLVDWAADHRKALKAMADRQGDYFQVRLCYPGQTISLSEDAYWQADDEAEAAALAYLTSMWGCKVTEWHGTLFAGRAA